MKKQSRVGNRLLVGLMFLFLYLPILLLIVFSFNAGDSSAVWRGFPSIGTVSCSRTG